MKKLLTTVSIVVVFSLSGVSAKNHKWKPDSTYNYLMLNTAYSAPMVHLGMQLGVEIPLKRTSKQFTTFSFFSNFGLEKWAKPRTMFRQVSFEPSLLLYNHQYNHTGLGLSGILHYRLISQTRLFSSLGLEYGRIFQFYRDAVVFDERNNPSNKALLTNGYNQLGTVFEFGFVFNKKKNQSIYYRLHAGLLFPYNHLANAYLRNEFGLKLISLR